MFLAFLPETSSSVFDRGVDIPSNNQVLWVQAGWKRGTVVALPEGQGCSLSLHPITYDTKDLRVTLAINLPTVEDTAVEPEDMTEQILGT